MSSHNPSVPSVARPAISAQVEERFANLPGQDYCECLVTPDWVFDNAGSRSRIARRRYRQRALRTMGTHRVFLRFHLVQSRAGDLSL